MIAFPFTIGFIAGAIFGIVLTIGLLKWFEDTLDEQDKKGS